MTKERKGQVATVTVLVIAVGVGMERKAGWRMPDLSSFRWKQSEATAPPEPQDAIYAMQDAARVGDIKTYLSSYTGQMETALRGTLAGTTESAFARYLKESSATIKGIAVADPQMITEVEAKVRVEYVYQDRNEAQTMYLKKVDHGWKISGAESDQRIRTLIPYGTPVK